MTIYYIIGAVIFAAAMLFLYAVETAPLGHEDKDGFHYDEERK